MNVLKWFLLVSLCFGAAFVFAEAPASQPDEIIIDMKYDNGPLVGDEPGYNYWLALNPVDKHDNSETYESFYNDVKKKSPNAQIYKLYHDKAYGRRAYLFIDYVDKKVQAVYNDTNNNGKLDEAETLSLNTAVKPYDRCLCYETENFEIETSDGNIVPFRFMFEVKFRKKNSKPDICWVSSGFFSGTAAIDEKKFTFYLFPDVESCSYVKPRNSSYVVIPENGKMGRKFPLKDLNSKIFVFDKLYSFNALNVSADGKGMTVKLTEDKTVMSDFKIDFQGKSPLKTRVEYVSLKETAGDTLKLEEKDKNHKIPAGEYHIVDALIHYGEKTTEESHCFVDCSKPFIVADGKPVTLVVGKPEIKIEIYKDYPGVTKKLLTTNTVDVGELLSIDFKITGLAGEGYGTIRKKDDKHRWPVNVYPMLKITDASGAIIDSCEFKGYTFRSYPWVAPITPGRYTITIMQDTGPLMGVIEAKREITVLLPTSGSVIGGSSAPTSVFISHGSSRPTTSQYSIEMVRAIMLLICGVMLLGGGFAVWWLRKKAAK